ncbi:MAG: hypothetical protein GXO19_07965, partial [Epsilonproteobacteria bacterium]|nr:hypothetical protein [Campylobacterota bacterium]NPA57646.1 hypothetical protein [Campylobacterota bacterium]
MGRIYLLLPLFSLILTGCFAPTSSSENSWNKNLANRNIIAQSLTRSLSNFTSNLITRIAQGGKSNEENLTAVRIYSADDYRRLYEETLQEKEKKREKEEKKKEVDLLWCYKAGSLGYYVQSYPDSIQHFDEAESFIKKYDEEILAGKFFASIGSLLTNDTFLAYRPRIYEKIMVNTWKG